MGSSMLTALVALLSAQQAIPERLYLGSGVVIGSSRVVGLAGAYVGIAEGADGASTSVASLAHRSPRREGQRDWDAPLSGIWGIAPNTRDLDTDGQPDRAP